MMARNEQEKKRAAGVESENEGRRALFDPERLASSADHANSICQQYGVLAVSDMGFLRLPRARASGRSLELKGFMTRPPKGFHFSCQLGINLENRTLRVPLSRVLGMRS